MADSVPDPAFNMPQSVVRAGEDAFGEHRGLGINSVDIKLSAEDGRILIVENKLWERGGPPRHLHPEQDEWFYAVEGEFFFEVGQERVLLKPGDSLLAPRKVPHVWAWTDGELGKILITFTPAGRMEAFFREVLKANAMPPQDPELWRSYGMELLGPPLKLK